MLVFQDGNREQFHTVHHKNINFNFGQYLTLWDHLGGTYKDPHSFLTSSINGEGKKCRFDAEMDDPHTSPGALVTGGT